jgi:hypothetical protein
MKPMTAVSARPSRFVAARVLPVLVIASALVPATAFAWDADVTNDTAVQFYDVRSPAAPVSGMTDYERRRLTTTLGVGLYNLIPGPPGDPRAPDLSFRARIRYDADYGVNSDETDPKKFSTLVPGLNAQLFDLMYAYLEGRRFAGGWLGFKLGRQYVTDILGWWAFDGGEVSVTTPYYFKAEAYGGLEERGGMPLSTPRFAADGVWRGNRSDYDASLYPQFQPARLAPAFAVALESTGFTWIHGRLTYRRVYDTGSSNTTEFAGGLYPPNIYDKSRISSERLGYAIDGSLADLGGFKAGIIYDFYRGDVTSLYGSLDGYLGKKVTVSADYDYYVPSFDGDSIWNFFAGEPMNDVGVRGNVDVNDQLSIAGGAHFRVYDVQTTAFNPTAGTTAVYMPSPYYNAAATYFPSNGHPFDEGGDIRARWRTGETNVSLRATGAWGGEGDRVGGDLNGEHVFESRYVARASAGVWQWDDKLRETQSTTTFSYVLGAGYRFAPRSQGSVEFEHDINGLVGSRFRLLFALNLAVGK